MILQFSPHAQTEYVELQAGQLKVKITVRRKNAMEWESKNEGFILEV
jgi:hypothetical protein